MLFSKIHRFKTLSSTNTVAFQLAKKGAQEGTVVIAESQIQGKGRLDRKWVSKPGNLYVSFILRPNLSAAVLPQLVFVSALAVFKTIKKYVQDGIRLKWPNDVLVKGKKVSGILLESQSEGEKVDFVIVGIGINANQKQFPKSLSHAVSLYQVVKKEIDLKEILDHLFTSFEREYLLFQKRGFSWVKKRWEKQSHLLGKAVEIKDERKTIKGRAMGLDENGALMVKLPTGHIQTLYSGDLIRVGSTCFWH